MTNSIAKIKYDDIVFHEALGHGAYGHVQRATFKKSLKGRKEGAAKTVATDRLREDEINILASINHPNIVQLLGTCILRHENIILLEYTEYGSLHDYLSDRSKPLLPELKRKWIKEAVLAVEYLHARMYLHRDLKASNCLLFENNLLKIADFGLAREINRTETTSTQRGTPRYMAPEIIVGNERGRAIFSKPADIYALGMLMLEIWTRKPPFVGMQPETVIFKVGNGEQLDIPEECPNEFADLMRRCWRYNPRERPGIDIIKRDLFRWTLERTFNPVNQKTINPFHRRQSLEAFRVACLPDGDLAVTDNLYILDSEGKFKRGLSMANSPRDQPTEWVQNLAIANMDILTVYGTSVVKLFDKDLKQTESFSTLPAAESSTAQLTCIATDANDNVFVYNRKKGIITVHGRDRDDRVYVQNKVFKIEFDTDSLHETSAEASMVVNSKSQILLHFLPRGSKYSKVLALDTSGKEVFSFTPKFDEILYGNTVYPCGIECDVYDTIYVALRASNKNYSGHIYRYSPVGELIDCIAEGLYRPSDLSLTKDKSDQSLIVANWFSILVYSQK